MFEVGFSILEPWLSWYSLYSLIGLELRDLPASVSQSLGQKAPGPMLVLLLGMQAPLSIPSLDRLFQETEAQRSQVSLPRLRFRVG